MNNNAQQPIAARAPADSGAAPAAGAVAGPQFELDGVIAECEHGLPFDATSLATLKRVRDLIAATPAPPAQAADSVLEDAAAGFFLQLPRRPKPEAPAGTVGLNWDAYSGIQMLAYGRECSDVTIDAAMAAKKGGE